MLVDTVSNRLVFRANLDARSQGASLARDEGLAGWVLEHREAALIADTRQDDRWMMRSSHDQQACSVLAVPLLLEQEALGVLLLIHETTGHFHADHQQLALAAAGQAAVALSKAQLYRYVSEQSASLGNIARQREEEASKILAMLRSIGDGVVVSDQNGLVRIVNPAAEHMLGINAQRIIERPLLELPGACEPDGERQIEKVDVNDLMLRAHSAPVRSSSGERLGTVVVYHDLTREEQLDRLKSRLVATASHELRTPMTSILGFVDMLRIGTYGQLTEAQQEPLAIIRSNVRRLVELVDDLLDMSRADAGELRLRKEDLDLIEILSEVAEDLRGQFTARGVTMSLHVPPGTAPIYADRAAMKQIAVNLLGNACKYTPGGGHVDVCLSNGKGRLRVDVRDNGVGIAPDAQSHIFTPFYRADNPLRDEVGGTGLGLSISQRLIELHGGRIWFESTTGVGSTFSFSLPLSENEPAISSQPPEYQHPR
jgi:signal transduction histidine kinase